MNYVISNSFQNQQSEPRRQQRLTLFDVQLPDGRFMQQGVELEVAQAFCRQFNSGTRVAPGRARAVPCLWQRVE